jgi:hypothetical protein
VILFSGNVQAGISPSRTEINLGVIPVDHYADPATTGPAYFPSCPAGNTLRQCVQWFFNNDSGVAPVNTNNYVRQGVKGVRFFFALGGGSASTPFDSEGNVQAAWVNNLGLFLGDLRRFGIESVTPTPVLLDSWSGNCGAGCINFVLQTVASCGQSKPLNFFPWLPFGLDPANFNRPDFQGVNEAYSCAAQNPVFWGWDKFFTLLDYVFASVRGACDASSICLTIKDFDLQNELTVFHTAVSARLIYDPTLSVDVIGQIRSRMAANGFPANAATFSTFIQRPEVNGYSCLSVYGDSAQIMDTSQFAAAFGASRFGSPPYIVWTNGIPCGHVTELLPWCGSTDPGDPNYNPDWAQCATEGMVSLPILYTQPSVTNMHSHVAVVGADGNPDLSVDSTATAQRLYSDVWDFLVARGLTANYVVFGETNITDLNQPVCDTFSSTLATYNVDGYRASTLFAQDAVNVLMRPWNNSRDGCYKTPNGISSVSTPPGPYGPY